MCDCKCCDENTDARTVNKELNMIYDSFRDDIKELSSKYLGKDGFITAMLKSVDHLPAEDRWQVGNKINHICNNINAHLSPEQKLWGIE